MSHKQPSGSAYGFRLHLPDARDYLNEDDPSLTDLKVTFLEGPAPSTGGWTTRDVLSTSWTVCVDASAQQAWCYATPAHQADTVVHPGLGAVAVVVALRRGGEALHAGTLVTDHGAVGLLAERGGGKSTTLGYLATRLEIGVLADDQLVLQDELAYAGPRCLDLRPPAVAALDVSANTELVRQGERHRLRLPAVPASLPLRGLVVLDWGDTVRLEKVPARDRLAIIARHRTLPSCTGNPAPPLWLASLPMRRLVRPRGVEHLPLASRVLLDG